MRIGKPESKDNLRFQDIKIGETFRPKESWTEEDEKEIFIKIREICDNSGVYEGSKYSFNSESNSKRNRCFPQIL